MKHTKEQLQGMSDLEINQTLTAYVLGNPWLYFGELVNDGKEFHVANAIGDPFYCSVINYCNNPSDIIPLAFEHKLTISPQIERFDIPSAGLWVSTDKNWNGKYSVMDKNPLRAIACCLILVLQDKE